MRNDYTRPVCTMHYTCTHAHTRSDHEFSVDFFFCIVFSFWFFGWTLWESFKNRSCWNDYKLKWMENKQHPAKRWNCFEYVPAEYNIVCVYRIYYTFCFFFFSVCSFILSATQYFTALHPWTHEQMNLLIGFGCEFQSRKWKRPISSLSSSSLLLCDTGHLRNQPKELLQ